MTLFYLLFYHISFTDSYLIVYNVIGVPFMLSLHLSLHIYHMFQLLVEMEGPLPPTTFEAKIKGIKFALATRQEIVSK